MHRSADFRLGFFAVGILVKGKHELSRQKKNNFIAALKDHTILKKH